MLPLFMRGRAKGTAVSIARANKMACEECERLKKAEMSRRNSHFQQIHGNRDGSVSKARAKKIEKETKMAWEEATTELKAHLARKHPEGGSTVRGRDHTILTREGRIKP